MTDLNRQSVLSRSTVFNKLTNVLSDVSSNFSSETPRTKSSNANLSDNPLIEFQTSFAHLAYRLDMSYIEHVHIRCQSVAMFDPTNHTSLSEVVLGIYPDTSRSNESHPHPILVRAVVEHRHRRVKTGDWILAINDNAVDWNNLEEYLSKINSTRKIRLTVRHPVYINSTFLSSLQPPFELPSIDSRLINIPQTLDFIHAALFYEKCREQEFRLVYQQPNQKDIFFAVGSLFPMLTQIMNDMNTLDSPLRSVSIVLDHKNMDICVVHDHDDNLYMILVYPPNDNINLSILEKQTEQINRLIRFLFGSMRSGITSYPQSIEYFFQIFFYRFFHLNENSTSILKHIRLVDEIFPAQLDVNGACPKIFIHDKKLLMYIDSILNQLECQQINTCSNDEFHVQNRYRRYFFVVGSALFYRFYVVTSHLNNQTTVDIYRFLCHYGYLSISQISQDQWQCLLFKEVFLEKNIHTRRRSFIIVCCQRDLILAVLIETEYEQEYAVVSPDHGLLQQLKLSMSEIVSSFPPLIFNVSPWTIASPTDVLKKQLKRTLSMPSMGGFRSSSNKDSNFEGSTTSLAPSQKSDLSQSDIRASQLISQASSQDDLYRNHRDSLMSIDDEIHKRRTNVSSYSLQSTPFSTVLYYLDFQVKRGLLIAPYFVLNKIIQTTLLEREVFETIQRAFVYVERKHFNRTRFPIERSRFSNKKRPIYNEIAFQYSISTSSDKGKKKKNSKNSFHFWIVARKSFEPIEHEFFVCYHDSIDQNISELAFNVAMTTAGI